MCNDHDAIDMELEAATLYSQLCVSLFLVTLRFWIKMMKMNDDVW